MRSELGHQSQFTGEPVGLIAIDVDDFKSINDEYGHARGDAVLRDLAYRLRKDLRAYDLAYRLGGEEFVVLAPGADLEETREVADRLVAAVRDKPVGGVPITISLGVAAAARGDHFDYDRIFAEADTALYRAKAAGRDRVCANGEHAHSSLTDIRVLQQTSH